MLKNYLLIALGICLIDFGLDTGYWIVTLLGVPVLLPPAANLIKAITSFLIAYKENQAPH